MQGISRQNPAQLDGVLDPFPLYAYLPSYLSSTCLARRAFAVISPSSPGRWPISDRSCVRSILWLKNINSLTILRWINCSGTRCPFRGAKGVRWTGKGVLSCKGLVCSRFFVDYRAFIFITGSNVVKKGKFLIAYILPITSMAIKNSDQLFSILTSWLLKFLKH